MAKSTPTHGPSRIEARSLGAWRAWLRKHHASSAGVWLVMQKKGSSTPGVGLSDAVDEAICWGWIDSTVNRLDAGSYLIRFTPRKRRSVWSAFNKRKIERLLAARRLQPAGIAKIEAARRDGSWETLDAVESLAIPEDLARAFRRIRAARSRFELLARSRKKQLLYRLNAARRPETRIRRIAEIIADLTAARNTPPARVSAENGGRADGGASPRKRG